MKHILPLYTRAYSLILLVFLSLISCQAQDDKTLPLFLSDEPLDMTLSMDVRKVLRDIGDERQQHPAEISYVSESGDSLCIPVRVRTRGHFRRDPMNCDFPPIRLNFSSTNVINSLFEGQDKIKLVTHCRSRGSRYEQNVLKEYLAYRLYNLFTDASYRVRLVRLTYVDFEGRRDTIRRMAFLLEPDWQMASRNHSSIVEVKNVRQVLCDPIMTTRMSVFQYMIGNTDWSIPVPHNIDLIQEKPGTVPVAVPFDFDWCGMVDAPYAVPSENLGIDDVKTRIYRGLCRDESVFELVLNEFRDKRKEIFQTIESVPGMDKKTRKSILKYIEQFYKTLDNPRMVKNEFYNACR